MSTEQWAGYAADAVVLLHFAFVVFVLFGGLLLLRWRKLAWLHLPVALWGILIEFAGWICPLTPLENRLRYQAGLEMYEGDFVMRYIMPILYPQELTRELQIMFGFIVLVLNGVCYYYVFYYKNRIKHH
jgi:hypothetical protein